MSEPLNSTAQKSCQQLIEDSAAELTVAWQSMQNNVSRRTHGGEVILRQNQLDQRFCEAYRVAAKQAKSVADRAQVISRIKLPDLYWAGAAHLKDVAAWHAVLQLIRSEIAPVLISRGRGHQAWVDAAENLSFCLFEDRSKTNHPARIATYHGTCSLRSWVITVGSKQALNGLRRIRSGPRDGLDDQEWPAQQRALDDQRSLDDQSAHKQDSDHIRNDLRLAVLGAASSLPEGEHYVLMSRLVKGKTGKELARELNLSESAVSQRLKNACKRLIEHHSVQRQIMRIATLCNVRSSKVEELCRAMMDKLFSSPDAVDGDSFPQENESDG